MIVALTFISLVKAMGAPGRRLRCMGCFAL